MPHQQQYQQFAATVQLAAADTTKVIRAQPGVDRRLIIHKIMVTILISAAQVLDVETDDGSFEIIKFPASSLVATGVHLDFGDAGLPLAVNRGLRFQPAAAGPGAVISVYGRIETVTYPSSS